MFLDWWISGISTIICQLFILSNKDIKTKQNKTKNRGFPGGAVVKNLPAIAGDTGSIPGPGRSHMLRSN